MNALEVRDLHAGYGAGLVLQGVSLDVVEGEAAVLLGRNGAGKTTTIPALARRLGNRGDELSGGEQQMLAIGRALTRNPALLLLDEPSEGLAPKLVREVGDALVSLRGTGLSILLVEQNLGLATHVGQRVHVMNKGTIVWSGTPAELAGARDVEARFLGV